MTEAEWLACEDPAAMLDSLKGKGRKLRLFACACCRRIWPLLVHGCSRRAVEVAEDFADGRATEAELRAACADSLAEVVFEEAADSPPEAAGWVEAAYAASDVAGVRLSTLRYEFPFRAAMAVSCVAAAKDPWLSTSPPAGEYHARSEGLREGVEAAEGAGQARLMRDIVGDPFRPAAIDPAWLTPAVAGLAQAAYGERELPSGHLDPARLAVLSDALEEAGCADEAILSHLRSPGPHVRGCWALDLILGKG